MKIAAKNPRYGVVHLFAMVSAVLLFVSQNLINKENCAIINDYKLLVFGVL